MPTLGILGLGEGRSTISAAMSSPYWNLKMICDQNLELCRQRAGVFAVGFHHGLGLIDQILLRHHGTDTEQ